MNPTSLSPKAAVLAIVALMVISGLVGALMDSFDHGDKIQPQPPVVHSSDR